MNKMKLLLGSTLAASRKVWTTSPLTLPLSHTSPKAFHVSTTDPETLFHEVSVSRGVSKEGPKEERFPPDFKLVHGLALPPVYGRLWKKQNTLSLFLFFLI